MFFIHIEPEMDDSLYKKMLLISLMASKPSTLSSCILQQKGIFFFLGALNLKLIFHDI